MKGKMARTRHHFLAHAPRWMHVCSGLRSDTPQVAARILSSLVLAGLLIGCASPAVPLPPSLKLPEIVTDLSAARVGDEVRLTWTTPSRTIDRLAVTGEVTAEICRDTVGFPPRCTVVQRKIVKPGVAQATDPLPAMLQAGVPGLLVYRVQLRNAAGKTAGPSAGAYAASGAAPAEVGQLRAAASKSGAVLRWLPSSAPESGAIVVLQRSVEPGASGQAESQTERKEPREVELRADDAGGAIDHTARTGLRYRYSAARVQTVAVGGRTVELRSAASASVTVAMIDVFPPDAPAGLVASPGFAADPGAGKPAIDLSWEPGKEARIVGYKVYRRDSESAEWRVLQAEPVSVPAYRDATVEARRKYVYRVTAVDATGNESVPGNEVSETAPQP